MKEGSGSKQQTLIEILQSLKKEISLQSEVEELKKKYDHYKKQALTETNEKNKKAAELQEYKKSNPQQKLEEAQELKLKLDAMKANHDKERALRLDRDQSL